MSGLPSAAIPGGRTRLAALLLACGASQVGNAISVLATPFLVLSLGGSGIEMGIASTVATVPVVLGGPLGAVLVDRIGYRRSSMIADAASGATMLAICVLATTGTLAFPALLALLFLGGLLDTPGNTAKNVLLPDLAAAAGQPLARVVAFATGVERAALMLGAPLGGILIALWGPGGAAGATAGLFALAVVIVLRGVGRDPEPAGRGGAEDPAGYWADLRAGFIFVSGEPVLRGLVLIFLLINVLDAARFSVLLPLAAERDLGGAAVLGALIAALGAGALAGALAYGAWGQRLPRRVVFILALLIAGLPLSLALGLGAPLPMIFAAAALTGLSAGVLNPIAGTARLELAPPAMRARAQSLMLAGSWAGMPLGAMLAGVGAETWGLRACFLVIALVYTLIALIPLLDGRWRRINAARPA